MICAQRSTSVSMPIRKEETTIEVDKYTKWLKTVICEFQGYNCVVITGKGGLNVNRVVPEEGAEEGAETSSEFPSLEPIDSLWNFAVK